MKMLNLGCGPSFHSDWINIDLVPSDPSVVSHDLREGLPFDTGSFDVCYSSHVLEHLRKDEASFFIKEQKRILRRNAIIRVVVPDLEVICRNYIKYLDELLSGNMTHEFRYDYSLLELYDQTTRDTSGGELLKLWKFGEIRDLKFVMSRSGKQAVNIINAFREGNHSNNNRMNKRGPNQLFNRIKHLATERGISVLLGRRKVEFLREGIFRNSGEIHRVMYDRYSLKRLLLVSWIRRSKGMSS